MCCCQVPGTPAGQRHLFIRASVECTTARQAKYVLLVALLVAVPMALPFVAAWSRREPGVGLGSRWHWVEDVRAGVHPALVDIYGPLYWWEAALMLQRLVSGGASAGARVCMWCGVARFVVS